MSSLKIFKTLLSLYCKSKFSGKNDDIISHRVNSFIIFAYDYPTFVQSYREVFLQRVYEFRALSTNPVIVDCGANIGMSVIFFKECYPDCELIAFEPNPHSFALLEMNVKMNNLKGIQLFNCALSDENKSVDFFVPRKKGSLNGSSKHIDDSDKITVSGKTLSDFIRNKEIDFIKIDIEGDEEKVIKDLKENKILDSVDELVVEFHYPINSSATDMSNFLQYFGETHFECQARTQNELEGSDNDLILHFKKRYPKLPFSR